MTLRVLLADDELMARRRLRRLLAALPGVEIVAECASGEAVLAELDARDVDVCFLDVRMAGLGGLAAGEAAAELGVEVVFTTAHPEHAVAAFDQGAADYVLKPVEPERLALALERARGRIGTHYASAPGTLHASAAGLAPATRLALEVRGEVRLVDPDDVTHALHDGTLVSVFAGGPPVLTSLSLAELESRLPAGRFLRVHRRALVNFARVERLKPVPSGGYVAVTTGGDEVPVSRQAARGLRKRMGL